MDKSEDGMKTFLGAVRVPSTSNRTRVLEREGEVINETKKQKRTGRGTSEFVVLYIVYIF